MAMCVLNIVKGMSLKMNYEQEEIIIPIARDLRRDRVDGLRTLLMPRQQDVPVYVYVDARRLVIDTEAMKEKEELPSIQEMLARWENRKKIELLEQKIEKKSKVKSIGTIK